MSDVAALMGADPNTVKDEMRKVLEFETMLANVSFLYLFFSLELLPFANLGIENLSSRYLKAIKARSFNLGQLIGEYHPY